MFLGPIVKMALLANKHGASKTTLLLWTVEFWFNPRGILCNDKMYLSSVSILCSSNIYPWDRIKSGCKSISNLMIFYSLTPLKCYKAIYRVDEKYATNPQCSKGVTKPQSEWKIDKVDKKNPFMQSCDHSKLLLTYF